MKKYITYLAAISAILLAGSCNREVMIPDAVEGNGFDLQLVWSNPVTRADDQPATVPGIGNENKVSRLDFYFFKEVTSPSVFHYTETTIPTDQNYTKKFEPGTSYGSATFPSRSELIGSDGFCKVFVVANYNNAPASVATLEKLKDEIVVDETFLSSDKKNALEPTDANLFFIMTGEAKVKGKYNSDDTQREKIELQRLASKISFTVNVLKSKEKAPVQYDDTDYKYVEKWEPLLDETNVRMYVERAFIKAKLGVVDEEHYLENPQKGTDYQDYAPINVSEDDNKWKSSEDGKYYQTVDAIGPFYTYPNDWSEGGADIAVKIIVPWKVTKTLNDENHTVIYSAQREVYYKVMLPEPKIQANSFYDLTVTLEPGTENEPEVTIDAAYQVVNWTSGGAKKVASALNDIKYLVLDSSKAISKESDGATFEFYGRSYSVPYSASGPVNFQLIDAYCEDFSTKQGALINIVTNGNYVYTPPTGTDANKKKWVGTSSNGISFSTINSTSVNAWFTISETREGSLDISHYLCNDLTQVFFDATPYTFKVKVYLKSDSSVYKIITLKQNPLTLIIPQPNSSQTEGQNDIENTTVLTLRGYQFSSYRYYPSSSSSRYTTVTAPDGEYFWAFSLPGTQQKNVDMGYVFINGKHRQNAEYTTNGIYTDVYTYGYDPYMYNWHQSNTQLWYNDYVVHFDSVTGLEGSNTNPNRYIIRTAVISDEDKTLGDPRDVSFEITEGTPEWVNAPALSGSTPRKLSYYKGTEKGNRTQNMIAPSFMVASSYGVTSARSYDDQVRRCASYQEDGYPAGRWRLPTAAEIEYCVTLSAKGRIPVLFGDEDATTPKDSQYWSANGYVTVTMPSGSVVPTYDDYTGEYWVRCVYDTWYWGEEKVAAAQHTFMWGDEQ